MHVGTRSKGQDEKRDAWLGEIISLSLNQSLWEPLYDLDVVCWFSWWSFVPAPQEAHPCVSKGSSALTAGLTHHSGQWCGVWKEANMSSSSELLLKACDSGEIAQWLRALVICKEERHNDIGPHRRACRINEMIYLKYVQS